MKKRILVILIVLFILSGCSAPEKATATEPVETVGNSRKLLFAVEELEAPGYTYIPKEELGESTALEMVYGGLKQVALQIDGRDISLPQAIREGRITLPDIISQARQDAKNGFCQESAISEHGVASYSYRYPECELWVTYDIYEMPDGQFKQIEELYVYSLSITQHGHGRYFVDEDSKWGYFEDREDWGITFAVTNATPTSVTIDYTQHGGQQIGELQIFDYLLYRAEDYGNPDKFPQYIEKGNRDADALPIMLHSETSSQIIIDWTDAIGAVDPGEYYLKLSIEDIYEESDVHPLMDNFYDKQGYYIELTIK